MRNIFITTPFALGLALAACGGDVPSTSQIKADFESPSGSTKSKQTVAGAYTKNQASGTATGLASSFSPLGGLTAAGRGSALERVGLARMMQPHLARLSQHVTGKVAQGLSTAGEFDACMDDEKIGQELAASLSSGSTSGSFDVDIDLASCSGGQLTGSIAMSGSFDIDGQSFVFDVSQVMTNVCETSGDKYCVTGEYVMEATMTDATISLVSGWFVTATWDEDGAQRSLVTKGGVKLDLTGGDTGAMEYLVYVTDENGEEVSLVLKITTSGEGATLSIRGSDGSLTCTVNSDGSGSCDGDLSWDEAYLDSLESDEAFSSGEG